MGAIADAIEKLIVENVREHGLVLWFDLEQFYKGIIQDIEVGQDQLLVFDGSFYKLRLEAEPFLRYLDPPKLLVYLPISWEQAREPLAEMLALGVDLRPGLAGNHNTRPAVIARRVLKGRVPDIVLQDLDEQIEKHGLTLAELEARAMDGDNSVLSTGLTVHFGTTNAQEAALEFLANQEKDNELIARNGVTDWNEVLTRTFGLHSPSTDTPQNLRRSLARLALASDLMESLGSEQPEALRQVTAGADQQQTLRAAALASQWRNRRDLAGAYHVAAALVESALHLDSIEFTDAALERAQTFACLERRLLQRVAATMLSDRKALQIAETRRQGFWAQQDTELQAEWALVSQAGQLLATADEIERALKARKFSWAELITQYTGHANWAALDTLHRRLEKRASSLEYALATPSPEVEQLILAVRRRHQEVSGAVAEQFLRAWLRDDFHAAGYVRQTEIYERYVAPEVANRRIAYVLVDALRWELACEMPDILGSDFETQMDLAIGTAPSITEIGMAALLPSAASGLQIGGTSKLKVSLHGEVLKNRADRIAYLKEHAGVPVVDLKLEDPKGFRRKLRDIASPALILVTSREIDQSGEDEMTAAREHMERVLTHLGLALRKLAEEGVERIVVTADHGYLYGEDLAESEKIDPPAGKAALCHRRVWAGKGGAASDSYLLTEVAKFGASSDLEMAVPWNLAGFRTSGPTAYFHGGLSPQEILLPVLVVTPKALGKKGGQGALWELVAGSAKVTTRFLSVRIQGRRAPGLFADSWPIVKVEVRVGGEVCAIPVSGSYGFQESTGAVSLRSSEGVSSMTEENTVALMLTNKAPAKGTLSIHLVDAATGVELKKVENVEVSLGI